MGMRGVALLFLAGCGGGAAAGLLPDADLSMPAVMDMAMATTVADGAPAIVDMSQAIPIDQSDMASNPLKHPDMAQPVDMTPPIPIQPGNTCTASSQCFCYGGVGFGCEGQVTAYGYCVSDILPSGAAGSYCVTAYPTWQTGMSGYWSVNFGDQSHVLPGFPAPGPNFIYGCSEAFSAPGGPPAPLFFVGQNICSNVNTGAHLHVL